MRNKNTLTKSIKNYIPILLLILMFGAIVYSLYNSGSWKLIVGFCIISVFFIVKSGRGLKFWIKWLSISPLSGGISIHENIIKELGDKLSNEQENKRNAILSILYFHKILFHLVYTLLFVLLLGSVYFLFFENNIVLEGLSEILKITSLSFFSVFILFGIWWWFRKTYPSSLRNDISYYHRILSRKDWEESLAFQSENMLKKKMVEKTKKKPKPFNDYWISEETKLDDIIHSINKVKVCFEKADDSRWICVHGFYSGATQKNIAGLLRAIIERGYLKAGILHDKNTVESIKEVFFIEANKSNTELQSFYGKELDKVTKEYVDFYLEKM